MRLSGRVALIMLFILFLPAVGRAGEAAVKVLVLPFEMHAAGDISATRRLVMNTLASALAGRGAGITGMEAVKEAVRSGRTAFDEAAAIEISKKAPADFAILGSITKLGRALNVDLRVFDIRAGQTVAFYARSGPDVSGLVTAIRETAGKLYERMLATLGARPVAKKGAIDRIVIRGNRRVDTEAIRAKLVSREGAGYSPDDAREDIRRLFGTGFFDNITVELTDTASGRVLTYIVTETPFIKRIEIKGNKELDTSKITDILTIKEDTVLDRAALGENRERIRALYAEEGFYLAEVTPEVETKGVEATVIFHIKEGEPVRVKRITFIGNERFSDKSLKKVMKTKEAGLFSFLTRSGRFNEFIFENDLSLIIGKYYDNGYINADILDHRVFLSGDRRWFYITIAVKEGEQYRFGKIDITGDILGTKKALLGKLTIKEGEVFSRATLSHDVSTLRDFYGDKGYAYAEIRPRTAVHDDKRTVDITFDLKKNELVYIEKINISGNTRTRDKVIRRELEVEEEKLYSSSALRRSRNNLRRLGFFEDVNITETRASAPDRIDINVEVKERPTGSISAGIGYSSVDKLIGTASISQANFMGTGIQLDLSGTISASSTRFVFGVTQPWLFDRPISAGIDLYNTEKEFTDFTTRQKGGDVRFGFPIYKRTTRGFFTYTLEEVKVFDVSENASTFIKEQEGLNTESSIKFTLRRDTRDDAFFPRHGSVITFTDKFAGGPLGGGIYMIKNELSAVKYFPLPFDSTFSIRGSIGYIQGYAGREPPIYERYFLGGINSIRGFETRSISPRDPDTGDLIGGNSMIIVNTEFVFPIIAAQQLRGVLFFDTGNAYKGRINLSDLRMGAGFGIRWYSPMGPLRLELGFNLDRREDEKASQFDFTIGTAF